MTKPATLRASAAAFLGADVEAAGVFSCDVGLAPLAVGAAGGSLFATATGLDSPLLDAAAAVGGVHAAHEAAARPQGLTAIMLVAVTASDIVLLDWTGNAGWGTGPSRELTRFSREHSTVTSGRRGANRLVTLTEGTRTAKISAGVGLLSSGKRGKRDVLAAIGAH